MMADDGFAGLRSLPATWPKVRSAITMLAASALSLPAGGCNWIGGRSLPTAITKGCPAIDWGGPQSMSGQSFGSMIDGMVRHQADVRWEPAAGGGGVVRTVRPDPLTNGTVSVDIQVSPLPGNPDAKDACRDGMTLVTGMTLNGERLDGREVVAALGIFDGWASEALPKHPYVPKGLPTEASRYYNPNFPTAGGATPGSGAPPMPAAAGSTGQEGAASAADHGLASRPIVISDGGIWCCVTIGQVADAFNAGGGSAHLHTGNDGIVLLDVTDPSGRWDGLQSFQLGLRPRDGGESSPLRPVSLSSAGRLVHGEEGPQGGAIGRWLRQNFHLIPPAWPKVDLGATYNQCLAADGTQGGHDLEPQRCIDAEYQRRDVALNAAYRAKMTALAPDRRIALRDAERAWLKQRQALCAIVLGDDPRDRQNRTYCMAATTASRTGAIASFE